jgi:polyphenol oxidase
VGDYACVMTASHFDCLVPDWPVPPHVRALCTRRDGGSSLGTYAGLNLGLHVGDDARVVHSNRLRLQAALGARAVFLEQVHGCDMVEMGSDAVDGQRADGAYTSQPGLACTVMVADCLPVLFCDAQGRQVAAAHAGWRGLLGTQGRGILEEATATFGTKGTEGLMAWLGPCIGPQAFEVGDEVRAAFVAATPEATDCFKPLAAGKWLVDLPGLARQRLHALGIARTYGNDGGQDWCTVSNPSRFFSHRRDGVSGRMAACIWRVD